MNINHCSVDVLPSCENEFLKVRSGGEYMSITLQDLKKQQQSTLPSHTIIITEIHEPVEKERSQPNDVPTLLSLDALSIYV